MWVTSFSVTNAINPLNWWRSISCFGKCGKPEEYLWWNTLKIRQCESREKIDANSLISPMQTALLDKGLVAIAPKDNNACESLIPMHGHLLVRFYAIYDISTNIGSNTVRKTQKTLHKRKHVAKKIFSKILHESVCGWK